MNVSTAKTEISDAKTKKKSGMMKNQSPQRTSVRVVGPQIMSQVAAPLDISQDSIISGALKIVESPIGAHKKTLTTRSGSLVRRGSSISQKSRASSGVSQRRGSLLCERRASELQLDNADRLSGLILNCKQVMADLDCDFESDYDE
ncbi:unnamed protein product [Cylindrotheca closterium]|uniref:Uncharacterized protein n=1 Tax=Cylindrotheca closterium TaxID=2856 RepID=A0AAD2PWL6_9STRA|nr:unnamed protein product [Cylindrotheca closterium]